MRVDGRVRPLIIAVKLTHRTVLHATDSFSTSLPPLPAESATRLALTVHYHIRLASAVLILHTGRLDCRHCVVTRSLSILICDRRYIITSPSSHISRYLQGK